MKKSSQPIKNHQSLVLEDIVVDMLYNENLKYKPYLVRFMDFNYELFEFRADTKDMLELRNFIENNIFSTNE